MKERKHTPDAAEFVAAWFLLLDLLKAGRTQDAIFLLENGMNGYKRRQHQ